MILTNEEYEYNYNRILKTFALSASKEAQAAVYKLGNSCYENLTLQMWLYVYALNSWDNTDGAINYLTEQQMLDIIDKASRYAPQF